MTLAGHHRWLRHAYRRLPSLDTLDTSAEAETGPFLSGAQPYSSMQPAGKLVILPEREDDFMTPGLPADSVGSAWETGGSHERMD
jgi:hypothetical protein